MIRQKEIDKTVRLMEVIREATKPYLISGIISGFEIAILEALSKEGCVLKVEREPETYLKENGEQKYYGDMPSEMYDDGWRLTEPLIIVN